jgi:UDP-2-acetamido-3-amino-2,3-dideoxy-glucuronate N-acetyltransferase
LNNVFIHSTAEVHSKEVGMGTRIWQNVVILDGARIGRNCNVNAFCLIEGEAAIGDNVTLKCGVYVWNGVVLEDDVFVGPNATFTNDPRPRSRNQPAKWGRTVVRRGASIGAGAVLLSDLEIGEYAMIGAGSLVSKTVGPYELWIGSPAIRRGFVCACGNRLSRNLRCSSCGLCYQKDAGGRLTRSTKP